MKIDLREVKTVCITGSGERRRNLESHMEKLQIKNWSFLDARTTRHPSGCGVRGCAQSHLAVLGNHDYTKPLLVLEDDAEPTYGVYTPIIDARPMEVVRGERFDTTKVDAIYLGYSWWLWGRHRAKCTGTESSIEPFSISPTDEWFKISRISSSHAILYLTEDYARAVCKEIQWRLDTIRGSHLADCDIAMADIQEKYTVIAPNRPYFFQGPSRKNGNEFWTVWESREYPGGRMPSLTEYCKEIERWKTK